MSVAEGTVVSAGWAGGGGKQVRIRHSGGYESYYLHLSAFGPGIRAGVRVKQGQMIGRVGATGTATARSCLPTSSTPPSTGSWRRASSPCC